MHSKIQRTQTKSKNEFKGPLVVEEYTQETKLRIEKTENVFFQDEEFTTVITV